MMKNLAFAFFCLAFLMPTPAEAVRNYGTSPADVFQSAYFTFKYGEAHLGDDLSLSDLEDGSDLGVISLVFGNRLSRRFAFEFEYMDTVSATDVDVQALSMFLVGTTPGALYLKGKVGYSRITQDFDDDVLPADLAGSKNVYGLSYGMAVGLQTKDFGAIEFEVTTFPERDDVDLGGGNESDLETSIVSINWVARFE